jgi:hypothetical protein
MTNIPLKYFDFPKTTNEQQDYLDDMLKQQKEDDEKTL